MNNPLSLRQKKTENKKQSQNYIFLLFDYFIIHILFRNHITSHNAHNNIVFMYAHTFQV
jgi:hypothetical protein